MEEEYTNPKNCQQSGGTYVTYKGGRNYKIYVGKRGGKYILVGKDKKKVYLSR